MNHPHPKHYISKVKAVKKLVPRLTRQEATLQEDSAPIPRITNDTVAEHREEVLSSARKYIYPLQHSKRRIVMISSSLLAAAVVIFFIACTLALYKFQSFSGFMYDVTKVVPYPVAKVNGSYVSYNSYLFELRRYQHYYVNQQKADFSGAQLAQYKKQAMTKVEDDAYVKQLAAQHHITVSSREVNDEVTLLQSQNRLGSSQQVFADVLQEYWGWSIEDFKREIKSQLLAQKVAAALDSSAQQRAQDALTALQKGTAFGDVAKQYSDDAATKDNGGQYGAAIDRASQTIDPVVLNELFKLKAGQTSSILTTTSSYQIVKVLDSDGTKLHAAVIVSSFKPIDTYTAPLRSAHKPSEYIKV